MIDMFSLTTGIPRYYTQLLSRTDIFIEHSRKFLDRNKEKESTSKKKFESVPPNATIREEQVKCGKYHCLMCPHGPYYYAYWKENGKLKKKYIGTKYDISWKKESNTGPKG